MVFSLNRWMHHLFVLFFFCQGEFWLMNRVLFIEFLFYSICNLFLFVRHQVFIVSWSVIIWVIRALFILELIKVLQFWVFKTGQNGVCNLIGFCFLAFFLFILLFFWTRRILLIDLISNKLSFWLNLLWFLSFILRFGHR